MGRRRGWKEGLKAMMKRLLLAILLLAPSLA
ncbi:MAG: hypothetical protein V7608_6204, partial [Hyphomicrobiales bacterium]